jgi:PAS domain S-box-containing protein
MPSVAQLQQRIQDLEAAMQRREQETDHFKDLVENARDLLQSVHADGSFAYVNHAWRDALGYDRDEIRGLTIFDVIAPCEQQHCQQLFSRITHGEDVGKIETTFITKSGRQILVEGSVNCKMMAGKTTMTLGIFRDITERKRFEAEREQLIAELKEALAKVKALSGLLPICAACKGIRNDKGYWMKIEAYLKAHSSAEFTHSICPQCAKRLYPDLYNNTEFP